MFKENNNVCYVVFALVFVSWILEKTLHGIRVWLRNNHPYKIAIVDKVYEELISVGFLSFGLFLINFFLDKEDKETEEIKELIENAHMFLFSCTVGFVFNTVLIYFANWAFFRNCFKDCETRTRESLVNCFYGRRWFAYFHRGHRSAYICLRLGESFKEKRELDDDFDFNYYIYVRSQQMVGEIIEVDFFVSLAITLIALGMYATNHEIGSVLIKFLIAVFAFYCFISLCDGIIRHKLTKQVKEYDANRAVSMSGDDSVVLEPDTAVSENLAPEDTAKTPLLSSMHSVNDSTRKSAPLATFKTAETSALIEKRSSSSLNGSPLLTSMRSTASFANVGFGKTSIHEDFEGNRFRGYVKSQPIMEDEVGVEESAVETSGDEELGYYSSRDHFIQSESFDPIDNRRKQQADRLYSASSYAFPNMGNDGLPTANSSLLSSTSIANLRHVQTAAALRNNPTMGASLGRKRTQVVILEEHVTENNVNSVLRYFKKVWVKGFKWRDFWLIVSFKLAQATTLGSSIFFFIQLGLISDQYTTLTSIYWILRALPYLLVFFITMFGTGYWLALHVLYIHEDDEDAVNEAIENTIIHQHSGHTLH